MKASRPRSSLVAAAALGFACLPSVPEAPDRVEILGVEPSGPVLPSESLSVRFSGPVQLRNSEVAPVVSRPDGRSVPAFASLSPDRLSLTFSPKTQWPSGERLELWLAEALVDELGREIQAAEAPLVFETRADAPMAVVELRMPRPTELWPLNLRYLAISTSPVDLAAGPLVLWGANGELILEPLRSDDGRALFRLPNYEGACSPLCPNAVYQGSLEDASSPSARFEITTATAADHMPPTLAFGAPFLFGRVFSIDVFASEPVVLSAEAHRADGAISPLRAPIVPAATSRVETQGPLDPEATYTIVLQAEDLAGNRAASASFVVQTPPSPEIEITELVVSPVHDWGDSQSAGLPFDERPGTGTVSDADQWVELVNRSRHPISLDGSGLVLRAIDASPTETWLETAPVSYFGSGGSPEAWWPGEALVLRLRGQMSRTELSLELWHGPAILDQVRIGDDEGAHHVGGRAPDLVHEALAKDSMGRFRFCAPSPGDGTPARRCLEW